MAAAEEQTRLQIGHVLFIDIVGYSKLLGNQQSELLRELNEVVSGTNEFREAEAEGKLIRLPTGDGMALVFRTDPEASAQCAVEIARALKEDPRIALRMGIHSGPTNEGYAQAREAATKAVAIDPDYAPAHAKLGLIAADGDNDLADAARALKACAGAHPADLSVLTRPAPGCSSSLALRGAEALEEGLVRRDPVNAAQLRQPGRRQSRPAGSTRRSRRSAPC